MPILFIAAEVFLLIYVLSICIRVFRNPFLSNAVRLVILALAFAVAFFVRYPVLAVVKIFTGNPFVCFTAEAVLSLVVFTLIFETGARQLDKRFSRAEAGRARSAVRMLDNLCNAVLVVFVIACAVLVVDFLANLAGMSPLDGTVREHSLYSRFFLSREKRTVDGDVLTGSHSGSDSQAQFLGRLHRAFRRSKNALAARTGARQTLDEIAALVDILNLPQQEMAWLVENEPELLRLKNNKQLTEALDNERIIELVIKVGEGSIASLYNLGDEPQIQALISNPEIRRAISSINLKRLRKRAREHMRGAEDTFSLEWKTTAADSPMEINSILDKPSAWVPVEGGAGLLQWEEGVRFGAGKAVVEVDESRQGILCVESIGRPFLWVNDKRAEIKKKGGRYEALFILEPGTNEVLVMMDLRNRGRPQCRVYALEP